MKYGFVVVVILLCCAVSCRGAGECAGQGSESAGADADGSEKSFIEAAKKGDAAFFKRTLADDFSSLDFGGELGGRQDMIEAWPAAGSTCSLTT